MSAPEGAWGDTSRTPHTYAPPILPEMISTSSPVVTGPRDVPVTGDAPVDAAMNSLRDLLSHHRGPGEDARVLGAVHERLAQRLDELAG